MDIIRNNQTEILEMKNSLNEIQNPSQSFNRLDQAKEPQNLKTDLFK